MNDSLEKNHVALMFEWFYPDKSKGESEEDVIVCELVGDPGTKRDINLRFDNSSSSNSSSNKNRNKNKNSSSSKNTVTAATVTTTTKIKSTKTMALGATATIQRWPQ